ncbi:MAG TPA: hypothetical protein V6D15_22510 [Oculatellaceae cyanobacterium]
MSRHLHRTLVARAIANSRQPRLNIWTVVKTDIVKSLHRSEWEVHYDIGGCELSPSEVGSPRQVIFN